ncbi:MAG: hypothetical protein MJ168_11620 [Clostridia bacterium]|nr:hypothetical protein [Clostridia bacterium]
MSRESIYYAEERKALNTLLDEIEKEKHIFSFRNIIKLIAANSIATRL